MANAPTQKWTPNKISLIKGQADNIAIFLLQADGSPLNIAGATAVHLLYKDANGVTIDKPAAVGWTYGLGDKAFWVYGFEFSSAETAALLTAKDQAVVVKIVYGSNCRFLTIAACLTVVEMPF